MLVRLLAVEEHQHETMMMWIYKALEGEFSDMPCLKCATCSGIVSVGGEEYMNQNYEREFNGWWVDWCHCVSHVDYDTNLPQDTLALKGA